MEIAAHLYMCVLCKMSNFCVMSNFSNFRIWVLIAADSYHCLRFTFVRRSLIALAHTCMHAITGTSP